jgi:probable phosphoglycerate mutase
MSGVSVERGGWRGVSVIVWLVRHGETDWNSAGRFQGWTDIPLNETGRAQARSLGLELDHQSFDGVWSSDLVRAIETARIAVGEPSTDPRLRELEFGQIEGSVWSELDDETRRSLKEFETFQAPGGEAVSDFFARVFGFFEELPNGIHVVFTHGGVIRAVSRACGSDGFPSHADVVKVDWTKRLSFDPGA